MSSRKMQKRSSCPCVTAKESTKTGNCFDIDTDWAEKLASSDKGSYYTPHKFKEIVPGNCVAANFVALFIGADPLDQKAIIFIVSYPVY